MSFQEAIMTVLTKKYADFSGRARRSEFWFFSLFSLLVSTVAYFIDLVIGFDIVQLVVFLALIVPSISVAVRRLHDTNRSGWWELLWLTFFGGILLIVWYVQEGDSADNKYGPTPKGANGQFNQYGT